MEVVLLEARDRVGGRIATFRKVKKNHSFSQKKFEYFFSIPGPVRGRPRRHGGDRAGRQPGDGPLPPDQHGAGEDIAEVPALRVQREHRTEVRTFKVCFFFLVLDVDNSMSKGLAAFYLEYMCFLRIYFWSVLFKASSKFSRAIHIPGVIFLFLQWNSVSMIYS